MSECIIKKLVSGYIDDGLTLGSHDIHLDEFFFDKHCLRQAHEIQTGAK